MYADVVVLTYQAPDINYFSYKIPKELQKQIKIGQLIKVPFGKRNPYGIVIGTSDQRPKTGEIKPISSIVLRHPLLLPYQIKLLKWMAFYYMAPMVNCLEAMLPDLPAKVEQLTTNAEIQNSFSPSSLVFSQSLILAPTINRIPETLAKFSKAKNYALYHNELKMTERFKTWLTIVSGKADFIFGSRSAIFAPCPFLKQIIIYDENDHAYKDERSPYFDTLTVASKISEFTGSKINIIDPAPKITTYHFFKNQIKMQKFITTTKIISMQKEKLAGNFSSISTFLQNEILKRTKLKQNILLFLNKKKESGNLFCKNCKFNDYFEKQPEFCPKCKSPDIYFNVLNTQSLESEVKKLTHHFLVNIKTSTVFYLPIVQKYDLIAYIQPDPLLSRADFSSIEILYGQIVNLKKLMADNGMLIIQTYNTDNPILTTIADSNYQAFYKNQINGRQALSYPPFALLIKLTFKGKDDEKVKTKANGVYRSVNSAIQQFNNSSIKLLGPYQSVFFSKKPSYNIICKYKLNSYSLANRQKAIKNITKILSCIPKDFQITVEPESIN
ncbi:hypothetical protein A2164_02065 [Candidatus Curtissbacteria bacterium RBG_13_35_7]|uniref:Primosomal protein N' 3' DNA-binding domain-containing protein n=1 Tax=Candidatus Curtissbacteria bacterium RBG_13_35_7 TaxID=1797705 RepID=A0A1F5G1B7_9BACT|nr:MAG: hypothetical protein A2164_02065 [Candidatus Curtissbacteria bacterium RBG_13_35_7]